MIKKLFLKITNNTIFNSVLIYFKLDAWMTDKFGIYKRIRINKNLSAQEMAGFSNLPAINEAIDKTHTDLVTFVNKELSPGDSILDIGCGAGAYLKHFVDCYNCTGIDLNIDMIERGKQDFPNVEFIQTSFLNFKASKKYKFIYCISVLEFIPPSKLNLFFENINECLDKDGYLFLHYPPAIKKENLSYPDLYYIEYAPQVIEKHACQYLSIIKHEQAIDGRTFEYFDPTPYGNGQRVFLNGYLMLAKKK